MMKIISTPQPLDVRQVEADRPELERLHAKAMQDKNSNWAIFGGMLTVGGREYQVVDDQKDSHESR